MDTQSKVFQIRICRMHLGWRDGGTINLLTVGKTGLDGGWRGWSDGGLRGCADGGWRGWADSGWRG